MLPDAASGDLPFELSANTVTAQEMEGKRSTGSSASFARQPNAEHAMDYSLDGIQAALRRAGMVVGEQIERKADREVFRIKKIVGSSVHLQQFINDTSRWSCATSGPTTGGPWTRGPCS